MSKTRFTALDVGAMVRDLRASSLIGNKVVNVYDITEKIYLFKFNAPGKLISNFHVF